MAAQHAAAVRACQNVTLVAVTDPVVASDELQRRFGPDVAPYAALDVMLREVKPDVVHIVTPPDTHVALAKECLQAGAHVYVEKPFALNALDAVAVLKLASERGLRACAAHQVLFQESAIRYRQYLPMVGAVKHVESFFSFKPVRRRGSGGGLATPVDQLIDILPHPAYLLLNALPEGGRTELTALDVSPTGEVRAVVHRGDTLATLVVTLRARPIESYLKVMASNGSVEADFVIGYVVRLLGPGASAPAVVLKPFSKAWQMASGSFRSLLHLVFRRHKSYPGLSELLGRFYASIVTGGTPPITDEEIVETVRICEQIGERLRSAEAAAELADAAELQRQEAALPGSTGFRGTVLLTGGTGTLGRPTAIALRDAGWKVRVPVRRNLPAGLRVPGVEYVQADLGDEVDNALLDGVDCVVHAAAETAGAKVDHERNTIRATRNLLDAMARTGVRRLVNISSVAVLRPGSGRATLTEGSAVDVDNLARGPYVWAKAAAELDACQRASKGHIDVRTIRLGPLVDYEAFTPPGRLGREVVRLFVAMGSRRSRLSVCSVQTAASVLRSYVERFDEAPSCVNLLEVPDPTRGELADRLKEVRPDLKFIWLPMPLLRVISSTLGIALRILRPSSQPLDLYAAFKAQTYDTARASAVISAVSRTGV